MQRLLTLKLASNLPKTLSTSTTTSSSLFHFQPHKTFSLTKTQTQNYFFSSFHTNPLTHQHKVHGFLSNPLPRKYFSLDSANALLRLSDCRSGVLQTQFPKQRFQCIPSQNSHHSVRGSWFVRYQLYQHYTRRFKGQLPNTDEYVLHAPELEELMKVMTLNN